MLANCKSCCPLPTCFCIDDAVSEDDEIKAGECCQEEEELQKSPGAESEEVVGMNSPSTSPSTSFASSYYRSDSLSSIMIEESADNPAPSPSLYPADLDDKGRGEGVEEDDNDEEGEDMLQLVTDPSSRFFKRRSTLTPENANTDILLSPNSVMLLSPSPLTDTTTALRKISTLPPNSSPTPWAIELSYFGIPLLDMRADPYVASGVPFFVAQLTQFLSRHFKELYALGGMVQNTKATATAVLKSKGSTPTIRLSLPAISGTEVDITPTKPPCYKQRRLLMDLIASSDLFFFPHVDDDIINDWSKKATNCDGKKARKSFPIRHLSFAAFSSSSTAVLASSSTAQTSIKMEHPILLTPASLHSHMACLAVSHIMSQIDMIGIEAFLETSEIKLFPHLPLMETNDETNFTNSFLVHKNIPYSTGSGGKNDEILHRKTLYSDLIFLVFLFLEKLPASLIPHKVGVSLIKTHDKWLLTHRGLNAKEKEDFRLLHLYEECLRNLLPTAHYNLVAYMLTFLRDLWVQSGRDEALMENLVTCFSCTTIFLQGGDLNDTALVDFNSASEEEMDKEVVQELSVLNPQTKRSNQSFYTTGPNSLFKSWRPIVRALLLHCTEIFAPKLQFSLAAVPSSFYISAPSSPAHMTTAVKKVVFVPPPNKEVVDNLLENNDIFNEPSMKQTFLKICKGEKTFILPVNQLVNKFAINPYRITTNKRSRSIDASYFSPKIQPSKSSPDFLGADGTFIPAGGSPSLIKRISLAATTSTNQSGIGNPMQCVQARLYNAKRFIEKHRLSCSSKGPVTFDDFTVRGLSPTPSLPAADKTPSNISFTIGGDDSLLNNIFNSGDNLSKDTTNNPLVAIKSCLKGFELFETVIDEFPEEVKPMDAIISHFVESDSEITEDNDDTWTTNSITSSESDELSASLTSAAKLGRPETTTNLPPNENFSNISLDNISDQEEEESVFKGCSFEHDDMDSPEARRWRPGLRFSDEKIADWNASFATTKTESASHSHHYRERGLTFSDYTFTKFGNEKSLPASSKSKSPHNCAISRNLENEATDYENESSYPSHHHRSSRYSYPPSYMTTCSNKRSPKLINKRYSFEDIDRGPNCYEEDDGMPPPSPPASHDPYSHYFDHLRLKNDTLNAISPKTESNQDLNAKLQAYQKKLKHHEELFERKNGHKPSHIEKLTVYEMKKYINKIDKLKKDIKALKIKNKPLPLSPFFDAPGSGYRPPNLENVEPEGALPKNPSPILTLTKAFHTYYPRLCDDFLLTSSFPTTTNTAPLNQNDLDIMMTDHESKNINDALILDLLDAINKESLYKQKLILQKVLLNFESVYGKPPYTLSSTVSILKPLYCKYRRIKNAMSRNSPRISMPDLPTIIEGHPWDACTETTPNILDRLYGTKSANVSPLPMQSTLPPHPQDLEEEEGSEEMGQKNSIFVFSPSSLPATIKNTGDHEESSGSPPHKLTRFTFSPQITSPLTTNPPIESCRVAPNTTPEPYSSKRMKDQGDKAAVASHLREITNGLGLDTSNIHSASLQELLSERRKIKEAKKRLKNLAYIPLDFLENHRRPSSTQDLPDSVVVDIVELTKQQQQHQPPLVTMGKLDDLFDNDFMLPPKGSNHKAYFVPNLQYYEAYKMAKNKLKLVNALIVKLQNKKSNNTLF